MWGARYNLRGLSNTKPLKLRRGEGLIPYSDDVWWVDEGLCKNDFSFEKEGLDINSGCIRFCSEDKEKVQAFIDGVRAVHTLQQYTNICPFEVVNNNDSD